MLLELSSVYPSEKNNSDEIKLLPIFYLSLLSTENSIPEDKITKRCIVKSLR